jgi:hypothetical protein
MSTRLEAAGDALIVAAALFALGMASGSVLTTVVGPEPSPAITKTATQRVTLPPRTLPPRTIEVTRIVERASRSSQRVNVPERTSGQRLVELTPITGWRADYWRKAQAWAQTPKVRAVIDCESSNRVDAVSRTGKYRGLFQFDARTWASYGGLEIARRADLASRAAQNYVAYRLFSGRGWAPWDCA